MKTGPQEQTLTLPRCWLNDCKSRIRIMGQNLIQSCPRCPPIEEPRAQASKRLTELLYEETQN